MGVPTEYKKEERSALLGARHIYHLSPNVYGMSSREANGTSKKKKLYDGNIAINQRVTSIMASIDDITGLPSYNDSGCYHTIYLLPGMAG